MIPEKFIVTDIETNGLLDTTTKFWCGWVYDSVSKEHKGFTDLNEYLGGVMLRYSASHSEADDSQNIDNTKPAPQDL